eukprot:TRINITY_DN11123_c0_g1_i1.p1 TRINITY_DN11123_c0_g1~~TRINITY_DN11123_c0_g1_i1.p1  ORF type:complete len:117 (-),score=22.06 TRINITY_DN11123_c0_g1_i1:22-372(-)
MEVASGEGEDDDGDPAIALTWGQSASQLQSFQLISSQLPSTLLLSVRKIVQLLLLETLAPPLLCGGHPAWASRGMSNSGEVVGVIIDWVSLLLLDLCVSFTDHQSVFCVFFTTYEG